MAISLSTSAFQSLRPPFLLLTPVCVFLGAAGAFADVKTFNLALMLPILVVALGAHCAVNGFNEYLDFRSGLDNLTSRTPFSGGSGALVAHPHALNQVLLISVFCLALTIISGLYLVYLKGIELLLAGILGIFIIIAYTRVINRMPITCLLTPGFAFGPLMTGGTYWVLVGQLSMSSLLISLPVFFMVNNLLLVNQIPDVEADKQVGRKTFPIKYGLKATVWVYLLFSVLTMVSGLAIIWFYNIKGLALIMLVPFLMPFVAWQGLKQRVPDIQGMLPFMGLNVVANMLIPAVIGGVILFIS